MNLALLNRGLTLAFILLCVFIVDATASNAENKRLKAVVEFSVNVDELGNVNVSWLPNEDLRNDLFSVERSIDGEAWFKIGEVHPLETRPITRSYHFIDDAPMTGVSFYRVKSITDSGDRLNAEPEMVYYENDDQLKIYPIKKKDELHVYLKKSILIDVQLFGPSGIPIEVNFLNEGYSFIMDTKGLNSGKYNMTIVTKGSTINRQIMII